MKTKSIEFDAFDSSLIKGLQNLRGGENGVIVGSRIDGGQTYVDIDWDSSPDDCDKPQGGGGDSANDSLYIGQIVHR